jgi:hypothetical protein
MQPANTWSSLAFVIAGAAILLRARNIQSRILGAILIFLGIGSAYYHATLTFTWQFIDVLGMYLVATLLLFHAIDRRAKISPANLGAMYVATNILLASILYWIPFVRRAVFGVIVVLFIVLERTHARKLMRAVGILALAFVIWVLDYYRIACDASSLIQGHAFWHVLGAVGSWLVYTDYLAGDRLSSVYVARIRK